MVSGLPSTVIAVWRGDDPLAAARAAGALLGKPTLPRAAVAHTALSLGWAAVLTHMLPRRHAVAWGAAAGLGIAAVDLGLVGRRVPRIRELPQLPQWLDHLLFGAVVGAVVSRARETPDVPLAPPHGPRCR